MYKENTEERKNDVKHEIVLFENKNILICPKYWRSAEEHKLIKNEVEKFLKKRFIEESESKYPSCTN